MNWSKWVGAVLMSLEDHASSFRANVIKAMANIIQADPTILGNTPYNTPYFDLMMTLFYIVLGG